MLRSRRQLSWPNLTTESISVAVLMAGIIAWLFGNESIQLLVVTGCLSLVTHRILDTSWPNSHSTFAEALTIRDGPRGQATSCVTQIADPIHRDFVELLLGRVTKELAELIQGRIEFSSTESWRSVYEKVLRSPDVNEYRSAAWVKTSDYWQDLPAQQSMKLNFELIDRGVRVERILIMGWHLWPPEARLPSSLVRRWIDDQHYRGIAISLVRENELLNEPDLLRDFGIYGHRATGEQELDEQSRTIRFILNFDQPSIRAAIDRWERLRLFSRPYSELLDQS